MSRKRTLLEEQEMQPIDEFDNQMEALVSNKDTKLSDYDKAINDSEQNIKLLKLLKSELEKNNLIFLMRYANYYSINQKLSVNKRLFFLKKLYYKIRRYWAEKRLKKSIKKMLNNNKYEPTYIDKIIGFIEKEKKYENSDEFLTRVKELLEKRIKQQDLLKKIKKDKIAKIAESYYTKLTSRLIGDDQEKRERFFLEVKNTPIAACQAIDYTDKRQLTVEVYFRESSKKVIKKNIVHHADKARALIALVNFIEELNKKGNEEDFDDLIILTDCVQYYKVISKLHILDLLPYEGKEEHLKNMGINNIEEYKVFIENLFNLIFNEYIKYCGKSRALEDSDRQDIMSVRNLSGLQFATDPKRAKEYFRNKHKVYSSGVGFKITASRDDLDEFMLQKERRKSCFVDTELSQREKEFFKEIKLDDHKKNDSGDIKKLPSEYIK